jgi:PleD family two-component response regulator
MRATSRLIGVLHVHANVALNKEQIQVVELLTTFVAVALQNAYLYEETERLATTDPLTGLSNYRRFQEVLELEIERARRVKYPLGFLMIDIDHFKRVNDEHGHQVGNVALQAVADALSSRLRRTDVIARLRTGGEADVAPPTGEGVVARLGGEEFGVILPNASPQDIQTVGEKLRSSVEALPPVRDDPAKSPTALTVSVGGVSLGAQEITAERLLRYADHALYEAKQAGRNRVSLWTESVEENKV